MAGVNTKDAMKKQIRRIHSVFSHVEPDLLVFSVALVKILSIVLA